MRGILKAAALKDDVTLQPHQQDALEHSRGKPGTIINHGLGSGKTVTSLGIAEDEGGKTLAVTPAALRENYKKEIKNFVPEDRHDDYRVESYTKFRDNADEILEEHQPDTVIADEVHRLRNPTKARKAFEDNRHKFSKMVGLTGTLANNHPKEAVPLTNLVAGDQVMTQAGFERDHISEEEESPGLWAKWVKGVEPGVKEQVTNKEELGEKLSPYVHRFTGSEEYEQHVPDVDEETVETGLSKKQQKLIKNLENANPAAAYRVKSNLPPAKQESSNLNAFMVGARQISNTPATHDQSVDDPVGASPKLQKMLEDARSASEQDDNYKGVQFSNFLSGGVHPLSEAMQQEGMDSDVYEGSLTDAQKKRIVERFNNDESQNLGLSPAGSEGLDLKGVKQMQITEPDWNPEKINQAIGRAARYKSHDHLPEDERKVNVKRYLASNPDKWYHNLPGVDKKTSVDEYIHSRAREKEQLNEGLYDALPEFDG